MLLFVLVEVLLIMEFWQILMRFGEKKTLQTTVTNKVVSVEVNEDFQGCSIFDF